MNIAINGFGRIGRSTFKALLEKRSNLKVVAINDLTDTKTLAHLLKYDSCGGVYAHRITSTANSISVDGKKYPVVSEREVGKLPWKEMKVDLVIESTGRFTNRDDAINHIKAGAKKVVISAPGKGDMKTIVLSVNEKSLRKSDKVFSMASCTTNCLAPVTEVLRKNFGIKKAIMTTIHSYTADQVLVDGPHKDLRRARAAALNMVPTTTGAAKAVTLTIPELKNKFDGVSIRVPTPVVSISDIVYILKKKTDETKVNSALIKASKTPQFKNILTVTDKPLVSSDLIGDPSSAIVDLSLTKVIEGDLLKVFAWYDNEWGYSNRLADICAYINKNKLY